MTVKTIYIEITNQCNLNCRTCYNRSGLNCEKMELSQLQIAETIEFFLPLGLERVLLSGGEPTLHSEFEDILDLIGTYPKIHFGIVTNGTIHNEKFLRLLHTKENFTVQISLDGSNEEQNVKIRGFGSFERAISFANNIHRTKIKPLLKMVISRQNIDDVESFYELALSLNCTPEFAFVYKSGNSSEGWAEQALSARDKLSILQRIDMLNCKFNTKAFLPLCTSSCPLTDDAPALSLCIKASGAIQPCQVLYEESYSTGSIFELDVTALQSKLTVVFDLAKLRLETDYGCTHCLLNKNCNKGCMAAAHQLHGDPLSEDGECSFRKLQFLGYDLRRLMNSSILQKNPEVE